MKLFKITSADGLLVDYVNPGQLLYVQVFTEPRSLPVGDEEKTQMASGQIVCPGGAFTLWKQNEMDDICEYLGIKE